jgi:predicted hydrocarbon binding protein
LKENTTIAEEHSIDSEEPKNISLFGYELLRETVLPEILGNDAPEILYWAGKRVARKFPLPDYNEIIEFFTKASWGLLEIKSENKDEIEFELTSSLTIPRVKSKHEHYFQLEAGFLAQQIETQKGATAETFEHPSKKGNKVQFTVKWDKKDTI